MRFITLFYLMLLISSGAFAQTCLDGWTYYRTMGIVNSSSESISDAPVSVAFDTKTLVDSAKLQSDAADLRIVDDACNQLPFFLDSIATAESNTLWVRIPSLAAGDTLKLTVFYGNDTASVAASGEAVFDFFDDFSSGEVDSTRWEAIGEYNTLEVNDGILQYGSSGANPGPRFKFVRTRESFGEERVFEFRAKVSNSNGFGFSSADSTITRLIFRQSGFGFDTLNQVAYMADTTNNGFSISQEYPIIRFPRGEFRDGQIQAYLDEGNLTFTHFANLNDNSVNTDTFQVTQPGSEMSGYHFILSSFINFDIYLDYLRVRKPIPEEIAGVFGQEKKREEETTAIEPETDLAIAVYPNPASRTIFVEGLPTGSHTLSIYDQMGQEVYEQSYQVRSHAPLKVNLPALANGVYWLKTTGSDQEYFTREIIILGQ